MRFAKPFTVTIASAALVALPFAGSALADGARPQPAATAKAPQSQSQSQSQPQRETPAKSQERDGKDARRKQVSLKVAVNPGRVRAGSSYGVTIVVKGLSSGTATVTSPEGKSYRVGLSGGRATKTLTVPSGTRAGSKSVSVKVSDKTATASFTVVSGKPQQRDDRHR